jgi:serine/threonine protein kinase
MELAEGSLLDVYQRNQAQYATPLPPEQVCRYLSQVARALDFLNTRQHVIDGQRVGIQHADIKPSNIRVFGDTIKLCDFGLATGTTARFRPHRCQGTPDYAAPEARMVLVNSNALGATLFINEGLPGGSVPCCWRGGQGQKDREFPGNVTL